MLNPCHFEVLISAILLTSKKTKLTSYIFIAFHRLQFGPWAALIFPVLDGLDLPFEPEMFFIEHYFAAIIGPVALIMFGRYGYFGNLKEYMTSQFFGFSLFVLYQRVSITSNLDFINSIFFINLG